MNQTIRTYSELMSLDSFLDRYRYLRIGGKVGEDSFGFDRFLNQEFYKSTEWRKLRRQIIIRDQAYDLAHPDRPIPNGCIIIIHHMNPISENDILEHSDWLTNPEYLISTTLNTHNAIHYGDESLLAASGPTIRVPNDTCPWR